MQSTFESDEARIFEQIENCCLVANFAVGQWRRLPREADHGIVYEGLVQKLRHESRLFAGMIASAVKTHGFSIDKFFQICGTEDRRLDRYMWLFMFGRDLNWHPTPEDMEYMFAPKSKTGN